MSKPSDFDIGPLTWVKGEIDQALDRSLAALRAFVAAPADAPQLKGSQTHFHQAHGALQIVGLDGATRLSEEIEALLADLASGAASPEPKLLAAAERAYGAIGAYLEQLLAGEPNQPLKLFAAYREVAAARGREADLVDLYYPDLSSRPPRREKPAVAVAAADVPRYYRDQRARYQRGLLKLLKKDWAGVEDMRVAIAAVEAIQMAPAQRAFWWVALGFFDALAAKAVPLQPSTQRLCNRIEQQLKRLAEGSGTVAERLMRETLFAVACAKPVSEHVRQVRQVYLLEESVPASFEVESEATPRHPALRALHDLATQVKTAWNKAASGHPASLPVFRDHVARMVEQADDLKHSQIGLLVHELSSVANWLGDHVDSIDDPIAMEVATSLLLVENAVENFATLGDEFTQQVELMQRRLQACIAGKAPEGGAPVPLLDEMSRRAQERLLMSQVVAEIQASLRTIEQALDTFFRDASKRAELTTLDKPVRQVLGALTMLNEDRAAAALTNCAADIQRFAQSDYAPAEQDFERVAGTLSGLGFYVDALQHGKPDFEAFTKPIAVRQPAAADEAALQPGETTIETTVEAEIERARRDLEKHFEAWCEQPEDAGLKEALRSKLTSLQKDAGLVADATLERRIGEMLALLEDAQAQPVDAAISQAMHTLVPSVAVSVPSPEASKLLEASDETVDAELLAIYLEEAGEVLGTIGEHLDMVRQRPQDLEVLRTIRRGYHTLKGSGRMVGLMRLGEAAWAVEQVMNRWLEDERSASPDLLRLVDTAREFFIGAVASLKAGGASPEESAIVAMAEKVKAGTPLDEVGSTTIHAQVTQPPEQIVAEIVVVEAEPAHTGADELPMFEPIELANAPDDADALSLDFTQPVVLDDVDDGTVAVDAAAEPAPGATTDEAIVIGDVQLSPTMYRIFLDEARGHLDSLRGAHALPLPGAFGDEFKRATHTLTGIAGTVKLDSIKNVSYALERLLDRVPESELDSIAREAIGDALMTLDGMVIAAAGRRLPAPAAEVIARLDEVKAPTEVVPASVSASEAAAEPVPEPEPEPELPPELAPPPAAVATRIVQVASNVVAFPAAQVEISPVDEAVEASPEDEDAHVERRQRRVDDDLDPQLLPIFLEEAHELVPAVGAALRDWRANSANNAAGQSLQRVLHTLKGSARMAGAMAIGELTHAMETRVENALALTVLPDALFDELENSYDRLGLLYERLQNPALPMPAPAEPVPQATTTEAAPRESRAPAQPAQPAAPIVAETEIVAQQRAVLRVRADMIDRLVNEAGEVSIARSRIEGEMRTLKNALHELTENVGRLRSQLREIEIQAETQMQSRLTLAQEQEQQFDPLEFDRFTRFQELTRMMAESVNDVSTVHQNLLKALDESDAALSAQARLTRDLQGDLMRIRMVPFASVSERLYRVVRQAAKDTGKRAVLDIRGGQVEVDRSVLERITAPFEHMLRNAVAHGVEPADERLARGKPEVGEIKIEVRQEGNEVMLAVSDDGAGLNHERIRAKAASLELIAPDAPLSNAEIAEFIFHPGFSTAAEVTTLAGRGVGMDVVKNEIAALGGRVEIQSEAGAGTRFLVFLPLTLAVTQAVLIKAGGATFAIPSVMVEQVRQLKAAELAACHVAAEARWQDRAYPFRYLPRLLGDEAYQSETRRLTPVIFTRSGANQVAIQVDEMIGNQEIVVKNTGPLLARVVGITGATVLGSGEIVLIINPVLLAGRDPVVTTSMPAQPAVPVVAEPVAVAPTVMIVDDSLTVRKITGRLLAREGYQVLTAKDGVDAMEQLQEVQPDVMLVDIEMPRMDGFDLTRNVRADRNLRHIPIIMITSRTAEKHRNYAKEIGVNVYLGKPYQEDELLDYIGGFVQRPVTA